MRKITNIIIGAALALTVTAAQGADIESANTLLPACKSSAISDAYEQGICLGIIIGVSRMALRARAQDAATYLCIDIPSGVTRGQTRRVVVRYIEERPARMHEPFWSLALEAMQAAWPCPPRQEYPPISLPGPPCDFSAEPDRFGRRHGCR
jgi:hypothetical protein